MDGWQTLSAEVDAILSASGLAPDAADELKATLADEPCLGSTADVLDVVSSVVPDHGVALSLSGALFEALRGNKRRRPSAESLASRSTDDDDDDAPSMLDRLAWRREFKSDHERFVAPYVHTLGARTLTLGQRRFEQEGFASTVWDSAIVLARALERWVAADGALPRSVVELGAGCGLVGIALAALGAEQVLLTDLECNLDLLRENARRNSALWQPRFAPQVLELAWGVPLPPGTGPFECIVASDVFYSHEAVAPLARTLSALAGANTEVLLAAGRNRQAADAFFAHAAAEGWAIALVDRKNLDPLFQSPEIDVWRLRRAG